MAMTDKKTVMSMFSCRAFCWILLVSTLLGCSGARPFDYSDPSWTKKGPGLISGEKGEIVLYETLKEAQ